MRPDVPSLRNARIVREIERTFGRGSCERPGFRLVHYSLQGNHAHLIVEAQDRDALGRGMKAIGARLARAVNRGCRTERNRARGSLITTGSCRPRKRCITRSATSLLNARGGMRRRHAPRSGSASASILPHRHVGSTAGKPARRKRTTTPEARRPQRRRSRAPELALERRLATSRAPRSRGGSRNGRIVWAARTLRPTRDRDGQRRPTLVLWLESSVTYHAAVGSVRRATGSFARSLARSARVNFHSKGRATLS